MEGFTAIFCLIAGIVLMVFAADESGNRGRPAVGVMLFLVGMFNLITFVKIVLF